MSRDPLPINASSAVFKNSTHRERTELPNPYPRTWSDAAIETAPVKWKSERDVNSLLCSLNSFKGLERNHSSFSSEATSQAWTVNLKTRKHIASDVLLPNLGSPLVVKELPLSWPSSAKHTLAILVSLPSVWTALQTENVSEQITVVSSGSYHIMYISGT